MGASQSEEQTDDIIVDASGLESINGWKILHIAQGSPCDQQGLIPYFDLITHCNEKILTPAETSLVSQLQPNVPITLSVLSLSTRLTRVIHVTPRRDWGGDGLLGLMIRYESLESVELECIHVLSVYPHSPAYYAGLQSYSDYLMGTNKLAFKGWEQLDYWLQQTEQQTSTILVFNSSTWRVREVMITPNSHWGGKGSLGADVAQGYLHRLPIFDSKDRRPILMDKKSGIRRGTKNEQGLVYEEGQLMMNLIIGENKDDVNIVSIRVREKEEYQRRINTSKIAGLVGSSSSTTFHDDHTHSHAGRHGRGHSHAHADDHSHSHGAHSERSHDDGHSHHDHHGHSHGGGDHPHSHGPTKPTPDKIPQEQSQAQQQASTGGKKQLTAQLPRSSPTLKATQSNVPSQMQYNPLFPTPAFGAASAGQSIYQTPFMTQPPQQNQQAPPATIATGS